MILTNCAACAAPLDPDASRCVTCVRCQTRYCSSTCQRRAWPRGLMLGHEQRCEEIHRGGGAEQYHAEKKYKEAIAVAVAKCADTKGQTCYICLEAVHARTGEGLVRMCACRGASGFAHVACLAEQAKVLVAEAEERDLDGDAFDARWKRWYECRLCEQDYHGVVSCALGWACWKTYVGRPETDMPRKLAMGCLGDGLFDAGTGYSMQAASFVYEARLSLMRRLGEPEESMLVTQSNLASTYYNLGRFEEALRMARDVYSGCLKLNGEEHEETLREASSYSETLIHEKRYQEVKSLLRTSIPVARRVLGEDNATTLRMRWNYASALCEDDAATLDDLREAVTTLEDTARTVRRVFGASHPLTRGFWIEITLGAAREVLAARETRLRNFASFLRPNGHEYL